MLAFLFLYVYVAFIQFLVYNIVNESPVKNIEINIELTTFLFLKVFENIYTCMSGWGKGWYKRVSGKTK
jgi:hypothetical protein